MFIPLSTRKTTGFWSIVAWYRDTVLSGFNVNDRDIGVMCLKEQCCLSVDDCGSAGCLLGLCFWVWTVIGTTSWSRGFSSGGAVKDSNTDVELDSFIINFYWKEWSL